MVIVKRKEKIPGSVPLLESIAKPYAGEPMIPW